MHGLLDPVDADLARNAARDEERTIFATVGVARSSVTLPGIHWVALTPEACRLRRYVPGSGAEYTTGPITFRFRGR